MTAGSSIEPIISTMIATRVANRRNWEEAVKEFDHPGLLWRDRQALILLITALCRVLPTEKHIDLLYGRLTSVEERVRE
ncbi:unnamed protein product [Rotaria sp. Silwood2]|nr:unnamed protein product [Rotaria sp. Silwood2]